MTVTSLIVRNEYTATAGQTVFNYTFLIFTNQDLNVFITPSGQEANDSTDLTTAYTVDVGTIGNPKGGFITLDSGVSAGDLVTIVSNIVENRTTDYQNSGDFLPDTVNDDFDRTVSIAKQTSDTAGRTLSFQESQQNATALTLDGPAALEFLRWKSDESGVESVDLATTGSPTDSSVISYNAGNNFTGGVIRSQEVKNGDTVSILDFGAVGDGVADDRAAIQAALDSGGNIEAPKTSAHYRVSGTVTLSVAGTRFFSGTYSKILLDGGTNVDVIRVDASNCTVEGLLVDGSGASQTTNGIGISSGTGHDNIRIINNIVTETYDHGIHFNTLSNSFVTGNHVTNTYAGSNINLNSAGIGTNIVCTGNHCKNAQEANISAIGTVRDCIISDNTCEVTDWQGGGASDADNITGYNLDNDRFIIADNTCLNSGNHGMHIGGDNVTITGNVIQFPEADGVLLAKSPNGDSEDSNLATISGNSIQCDPASAAANFRGIEAINAINVSITGNSIIQAKDGIFVTRQGSSTTGGNNTSITGNTIRLVIRNGINVIGALVNIVVQGNVIGSDDTRPGASVGIDSEAVSRVSITNNTIQDFDQAIDDVGDITCLTANNTATGQTLAPAYRSQNETVQSLNLPQEFPLVVSAATIDIGSDFNASVGLTGTTTISALNTPVFGRRVTLFGSADTRTITHGLTTIALAGSVDMLLEPGDTLTLAGAGLAGWQEIGRKKA